jgi:hypothetical protein
MSRAGAGVLLGLGLLLAQGTRAAAQSGEQLWRWIDGQGGFCIWYLTDPAVASDLAPAGMRLRTVAEASDLPSVLVRIVQDEPRFAEWIPGVVCVGLYVDVAADGVPVGHMEDGRPVLLTLTGLAAHEPLGQAGAQWYLREIGLDAGRLDRVARDRAIRAVDRDFRTRTGLEGDDDEWELQLDGTRLVWSGHPTGDVRVGSTRSMSFGYAGDGNARFEVVVRTAPAEEQNQLGALRVEGRNPLAQALKSSPIRTVGPLELGGELTVTFRLDPSTRP